MEVKNPAEAMLNNGCGQACTPMFSLWAILTQENFPSGRTWDPAENFELFLDIKAREREFKSSERIDLSTLCVVMPSINTQLDLFIAF